MNLWQELVSAAVVGTSRQFQKPLSVNGKLGNFLSRLDSADPEAAVLAAAGAYQVHQNAGQFPQKKERSLPLPCEADRQPECSYKAAENLGWILRGKYPAMLQEWLRLATATGQRVPEQYLPALLEIGREHVNLRSHLLPVLGKRGRWLAAQNPDWDYAAGEDDRTIWESGSANARQLLLQRLRAENSAAARELVAASWGEENSENKAALLASFKTGLTMADESFLETCLDDSSQEVRRTVADLLGRLPESRLVARMIKRVSPLLTLNKDSEPLIDMQLPESCDDEAIRDGIVAETDDIWGDESWWMLQMIGFVPPAFWREKWGISPTEIVPKICEVYEGWDLTLMAGWARAAARYGDADLAEALLKAYPIASEFYYDNYVAEDFNIQELMNALPPPRRETFIMGLLLSEEGFNYENLEMLNLCQFPWSAEISRAVLESWRRNVATGTINYPEQVRSLFLEIAAPSMPLSLIDEALALLADVKDKPDGAKIVDELVNALQFRHDLIKEF